MQSDVQQNRLGQTDTTLRPRAPGFLTKILVTLIGVALLIVGFAVSLVMLAVVVAAGIVIAGFLWWKTRDLRKQLREQAMRAQQTEQEPARRRPGVRMGEGDAVQDVEFQDEIQQK